MDQYNDYEISVNSSLSNYSMTSDEDDDGEEEYNNYDPEWEWKFVDSN